VRPAALLPGGVGVIERVIPDVGIEVQVLLIPDGISLQGLSVLTRLFVDAEIFPRRTKRVSGFSPSCPSSI